MKNKAIHALCSFYLIFVFSFNLFASNKYDFEGAQTNIPASRWEEGMVSGNGTMGAIMFGNTQNETIIVNHNNLFLTLGTPEFVYDLSQKMPFIKQEALKKGAEGPKTVHTLMNQFSRKEIYWTDPFHPAFSLTLHHNNPINNLSNYNLKENFVNGEISTEWTDHLGKWSRKLFVSRADDVIVMEIKGPKKKVNETFSLAITHELLNVKQQTTEGGEIIAHVTYKKGKGGYDNVIRIIPNGGNMIVNDSTIEVQHANSILVFMKVKTWKTPLPENQSEAWAYSKKNPCFKDSIILNQIPSIEKNFNFLTDNYASLLKKHQKIHSDLYSRVSLSIGNSKNSCHKSSQELIQETINTGKISPELTTLLYNASRYLIICSTGDKPANLQGIWTGTWEPAWSSDYTLDTNLQLEIQSLLSCNLPELMQGYFNLVESWVPDCRTNALKQYGCRGIVCNTRASNTPLYLHWAKWPGELAISCMGWLIHYFYDYYQFTGDTIFLKDRVVPLLKENVQFYEDLLKDTDVDNGKYRFFLSYSPEQDTLLYANATIDISVCKTMLTYLIKSCQTLNIEKDNIVKWETMLSKMPSYLINDQGLLKEWATVEAPENPNHRHHSQFLPLYQFCEFDNETNPQLWDASKKAYEAKEHNWFNNPQSIHITHGMINQGQCAARLGRGDVVNSMLERFVTDHYIFPSFMLAYWPNYKGYGIDPNGTIPDIINNSLAFAWENKLWILPALPSEWNKGSIRNILLRGQMQLKNLEWDTSEKEIRIELYSKIDQEIEFILPNCFKEISFTKGYPTNTFTNNKTTSN